MLDIVIVAASAQLVPGLSEAPVTERILGRPAIGHTLAAASALEAPTLVLAHDPVVSAVGNELRATNPHCDLLEWAADPSPAAALLRTLAEHDAFDGTALILAADAPLLTDESLKTLIETHSRSRACATILATHPVDSAYKAAYAFDLPWLHVALEKLAPDRDSELALLPMIELLLSEERLQTGVTEPRTESEALRCVDPLTLSHVRGLLRTRINQAWITRGVMLIEPESAHIDAGVRLEPGVRIEPRVILRGSTVVEADAVIGPDATLSDTIVRAGAGVVSTHAVDAVIGAGAQIGPFAYLRPGTVLGERTKVGTFVEVKQAEIAEGTQIAHLAYVGNAVVGRDVNIGAGTTFSLYDGLRKHATVVGDAAFIGCQTSLVAPVRIGPGAFTGAGSVITDDVPAGALAIARPEQHNVDSWVTRHRPGTRWADAARAACEAGDHAEHGRDDDA